MSLAKLTNKNLIAGVDKVSAGMELKASGTELTEAYPTAHDYVAATDHRVMVIFYEDGVNISDISKASSGVVTTSSAHGLSPGDRVGFVNINGMREIQGQSATVLSPVTSTTFTIDIDTTGYEDYLSPLGNIATPLVSNGTYYGTKIVGVPIQDTRDSNAWYVPWKRSIIQGINIPADAVHIEVRQSWSTRGKQSSSPLETNNVYSQKAILNKGPYIIPYIDPLMPSSEWYINNGAPDNDLGIDGDNYLDESNGNYYQKSDGVWVQQNGNLSGPAGYSTVVLNAYKRSAASPGDNPGAIDYTFSTNTVDSPGYGNGWTRNIPAVDGNPLWVRQATASSQTDTDNIGAGEWSGAIELLNDGADGTDGLNNATVYLYQRTPTSTAPNVTTQDSVYTFSSGLLSSPLPDNGWSQTLPVGGDPYLWLILATASNTTATDTIDNLEWSTPELLSVDGADGATGSTGPSGYNNKILHAYQRSVSDPGTNPGAVTYNFSTDVYDSPGLGNSWLETIPAADGNPLWVVSASASSQTDSDSIGAGEWTSSVKLVEDGSDGSAGADGLNNATVYLYQRTPTSTAPNVTTQDSVYTFSSGLLSSPLPDNGWSQTLPTAGDPYLWMILATASNTTATDVIDDTEWSTPELLSVDGADGAAGATGDPGIDALAINYTNNSHSVPVDNLGAETWTGSGGDFFVFEGDTLLTLDQNAQSTGYPTTPGEYRLDIVKISGDTLTEPGITGQTTTTATLADWAGNLTTATVYKVTAYIYTLNSVQVSMPVNVTLSPSLEGADGATGSTGAQGDAGVDAIAINYTNNSHSVPVDNLGAETWTGSGGKLYIYEGNTLLTLDQNAQSAAYPTTPGEYRLNITKITGDTLTEPGITGQTTTEATLADWAGNLTTATVYKIDAYVYTSGSIQVLISTYVTLAPSLEGADGATGSTGATGDDGLRTVQGYLYYEKTTAGAPAAPSGNTYTFSTGLVTGTGINDAGTTNTWRNEPRAQDATTGNYYHTIRYYGTEASAGDPTIAVSYSSSVVHTEFSGVVRFINGTEIADGATTYDPAADVNLNTTTIDGGKITALTIDTGQLAAGAITTAKIDALAVDTGQLAAGAVTAAKIEAGTITANEIDAGTITANELNSTLSYTGELIIGVNGGVHSLNKDSFGDATNGWWLGYGSVGALTAAQDETHYDNSPTSEGTFAGGTSYSVSDTINMSDGSVITVDAVSAGVVTQFTVTTAGTDYFIIGATVSQVTSSGNGEDFSVTPDTDNTVVQNGYMIDVGDSTKYFRWNASSLSLAGNISMTSGTITAGGVTVGKVSLSDSNEGIEILNADDVSILSVDATTKKLLIDGKLQPNSQADSSFLTNAAIADLHSRLGTSEPTSPKGGTANLDCTPAIAHTAAFNVEQDYAATDQDGTTGFTVGYLDLDNSATVTLSATWSFFASRTDTTPSGWTAPTYSFQFQIATDGAPTSWSDAGAAVTLVGIKQEIYEPETGEYYTTLRANGTKTQTHDVTATDGYHFRVQVTRTAGDEPAGAADPKLTAMSGSSPVTGEGAQAVWKTISADTGTDQTAATASDILEVAGGTGIDTAMSTDTVTINLDVSELSVTTMAGADWIVFDDAGNSRKALISSIPLSIFDNDLGAGGDAVKANNETITGTWTLDGAVTGSDFGTGGKVKDGGDTARPIGFNVLPIYEIDANDTFDLAHNGMLWHKDAGAALTFTCGNDSTIPQGATYVVHNDDTENLTIAQGSGVTVTWLQAGGAVNGNVTIEPGGLVTVYKYTDTEFWVWGSKATAASGVTQLSDLSDVGSSTATNKFVLIADGAVYQSRALVEADISDLGTYAVLAGPNFSGSPQISGVNIATVNTNWSAADITSGTLVDDRGGTGQSTYATGDMLYASGANTLAKRAAGTDTHVLTMVSGTPQWQAPAGGGGGDLKADGSVPMTADWTYGNFNLNGIYDMDMADILGDRIMLYGAKDSNTSYGLGIESNTMYYRSSVNHRWYVNTNADGGTSDYMNLSTGLLAVNCDLRVSNSTAGTDYANFAHDGTNFNTTFANTGKWIVHEKLQVQDTIDSLNARTFAVVSDDIVVASFEANRADGMIVDINQRNASTTNAMGIRFEQGANNKGFLGWYHAEAAMGVGQTYSTKPWVTFEPAHGGVSIWDSGNTDYVRISHDGTNALIHSVNTNDLTFSGASNLYAFDKGIAVTGNIGGTTHGGIVEANLIDKTATENITGAWTTRDFRKELGHPNFGLASCRIADLHFKGNVRNQTIAASASRVTCYKKVGGSWSEDTVPTDTQKRKLLAGTMNAAILLTNTTHQAYRIEIDAHPTDYVYINQIFGYTTTSSQNMTIHVYRRQSVDSSTWDTAHTSSSAIAGWPTPFSMDITNTAFRESSGGHDRIRVEFTPTWTTGNITIDALCLYGDYPLQPDDGLYTWDEDLNVTYKAKLFVNDTFYVTNSTGSDFAAFSHDGTNFNTAFTATADWNITGATGMYKFDNDVSVTGDIEGNNDPFNIVNRTHGGNIQLETETLTSGFSRKILIGDPDGTTVIRASTDVRLEPNVGNLGLRCIKSGATELYHSNTLNFRTQANLNTGNTSAAEVKDHQSNFRDVGFNDVKLIINNTSITLGAQYAGGFIHSDNATTYTITTEASGVFDFPAGSRVDIINAGTGNISVNAGSGATIKWFDGASVTSGNRTVGEGGWATLHRYDSTDYYLVGVGIS